MKLFVSTVLAAVLWTLPSLADDCMQSTCSSEGAFRCQSECPLAHDANARRSFGTESVTVSKIVRADFTSALERNLARI